MRYIKKSQSEYSKKLLDPRWQKKRLEVLNRDNFTCLVCCATDKTLHVHHVYYEPNLNPWEYPTESLKTICCECHSDETLELPVVEKDLILNLKKLGFMAHEIELLSGAFFLLKEKCLLGYFDESSIASLPIVLHDVLSSKSGLEKLSEIHFELVQEKIIRKRMSNQSDIEEPF